MVPTAEDVLAAALDRICGRPDGPPGGYLGVASGGRLVVCCRGQRQVSGAHGEDGDERCDQRCDLPMTAETWHDLGSVTKVVATTSMIMTLVDAGEVGLEDRAARWLAALGRDGKDEITVADLLTHRAGLWEWWPIYLSTADRAAAAEVAAALPLRYAPRCGRHYSDLGFQILGRIVELATGLPLDQALDKQVLDPLGLSGIRYARPLAGAPVAASSHGDRIERTMIATGSPYPVDVDAAGFARWRTGVLVGEVNDGNAFHAYESVAGHAGLFAVPADLHRFGRALLDCLEGGGVWRRETVRRFFADGPDPGQALGLRTWVSSAAGCRTSVVGHPGFPGIGLAVLPDHDATIVLATNRLHVAGEPVVFNPLWNDAVDAGHAALHEQGMV